MTKQQMLVALESREQYNEVFYMLPLKARLAKRPFLVIAVAVARRVVRFFIRIGLLPPFSKATTFFAERMKVAMPSGMLIKWFGFYEGYELPFAKFLINHVKEGDVFIDGGAYDGYFSLLASGLVGRGTVHAFEPTPQMCAIVRENTKSKKNIVVNQVALWKETGEVQFTDFIESDGQAGNSIYTLDELYKMRGGELQNVARSTTYAVPAVSLDDYCKSKNVVPSFIQLDTEGAEFEVLKGAREVLQKGRPIVCVEVWRTALQGEYREMVRYMEGLHYAPFFLEKDGTLTADDFKEHEGITRIFVPR